MTVVELHNPVVQVIVGVAVLVAALGYFFHRAGPFFLAAYDRWEARRPP